MLDSSVRWVNCSVVLSSRCEQFSSPIKLGAFNGYGFSHPGMMEWYSVQFCGLHFVVIPFTLGLI